MDEKNQSYFDGGLLQLIGYNILSALITMITFGIGLPWGVCLLQEWETKHTVVEGKRLRFDGKGGQLFGNYIKWLLLTVITLGIYGFWLTINMKKWVAKHTFFEN